jgi:hypothetical protein
MNIKVFFDLERCLKGCKLLVYRRVRKKDLRKIGCVFFFIFHSFCEALMLALGPAQACLARAFNPRPETSPARDRAGTKKA